jgi:dihydrofolate reductase
VSQLLRVQNFTVSTDGFGAGDGQSLERPFGSADPGTLMSWALGTASFPNRSGGGGSRGLDDYFTRDFAHGIGAEIMGRNKFGPQRGPWTDHEWQGWWGDEPPFHTPVFVLTHHPRPSFTLSDTTFHFVGGEPAEVLAQARAAAAGRAVRLGGGAGVVREFLDADLVDTLHVVVVPTVELGAGSRLWHSPDELLDRFHRDVVPSPSGVVHHLYWRR